MTAQSRSTLRGLFANVTLLAFVALLIAALFRWQEIGWGGLIWLGAIIGQTLIRTPHSIANRANQIVAARKDAQERVLLTCMFLCMMFLPLLHLATNIFAFSNYTLPQGATFIGAALQLPFLWLFWASHHDLGRNWSPALEVREQHGLITRGVYRFMRHPMYAAIWLGAIAQPLLIQNWIAGALVVPAFAAMWFLRVPQEEAMMREAFGADYDEYCLRVGRLWPRATR